MSKRYLKIAKKEAEDMSRDLVEIMSQKTTQQIKKKLKTLKKQNYFELRQILIGEMPKMSKQEASVLLQSCLGHDYCKHHHSLPHNVI